MRVLVTGGAGFIGGSCVQWLLRQGHEVVVVDTCRDGPTPRAQKLETLARCATLGPMTHLALDVADPGPIAKRAGAVDAVVHLAALTVTPTSKQHGGELGVSNVNNTTMVHELAARCRARRFVLASTGLVYGLSHLAPQHEDQPRLEPNNTVGASNKAAEFCTTVWSRERAIPATTLRLFTVYGRGQRPDTLVARFMQAAARGEPLAIAPGTSRDLVHVHDVARAIELALEQERPGHSVYNVGTGVQTSLDALAERIAKVVGRPLAPAAPAEAARDIGRSWADPAKARAELGFEAEVALDEGLPSTWAWQRSTS